MIYTLGGIIMKYRKFGREHFDVSLLGFGAMRLPIIGNDTSEIDEEKAIKLIRHAINNGVNFVDTAYVYHGGKSEIVVGKALKDGFREKVKISTKLPTWLAKSYEDFEKLLDTQLERLDVDYIDVFLLHALNKKEWDRIKELGVLKFLDEAIEKGKIKYPAFSMHDSFEVFKDIVDSYDWSMCLIQLNYIDEDSQAGIKGLKYAGQKNIAVAIMEPLKGGLLANPPKEIQEEWDTADTKRSAVGWSLSYLANFPEIKVILSGMNRVDHLDENIKILSECDSNSLSELELNLINKVKNMYNERIKVPCSKCGYCMPCPAKVNIPYILNLYNMGYIYNDITSQAYIYNKMLQEDSKGSNCVDCKKCEEKCPQGIKISEIVKEADREFSKITDFSTMRWYNTNIN